MKFICENCQSRYFVDDAKVAGRTVRIRCKRCDHLITLRQLAAPARAGRRVTGPGAIRTPLTQDPTAVAPTPVPDLGSFDQTAWHYAVNGQSFGPFDEDDLIAKFLAGQIGEEAYVWNGGMDDWRPALEIPVFSPAIAEARRRNPQAPTLSVADTELPGGPSVPARHSPAGTDLLDRPGSDDGPQPSAGPSERAAPVDSSVGADAPKPSSDETLQRLRALRAKLLKGVEPAGQQRPAPVADSSLDPLHHGPTTAIPRLASGSFPTPSPEELRRRPVFDTSPPPRSSPVDPHTAETRVGPDPWRQQAPVDSHPLAESSRPAGITDRQPDVGDVIESTDGERLPATGAISPVESPGLAEPSGPDELPPFSESPNEAGTRRVLSPLAGLPATDEAFPPPTRRLTPSPEEIAVAAEALLHVPAEGFDRDRAEDTRAADEEAIEAREEAFFAEGERQALDAGSPIEDVLGVEEKAAPAGVAAELGSQPSRDRLLWLGAAAALAVIVASAIILAPVLLQTGEVAAPPGAETRTEAPALPAEPSPEPAVLDLTATVNLAGSEVRRAVSRGLDLSDRTADAHSLTSAVPADPTIRSDRSAAGDEGREPPPDDGSGDSIFAQLGGRTIDVVREPGRVEASAAGDVERGHSASIGSEYFAQDLPRIRRAVERCHSVQLRDQSGPRIERVELAITVQPNGSVSMDIGPELTRTTFFRCLQTRYASWTFRQFEGDPVTLRRTYALE